jgi:deoxyadenosine/deoxycytidine kinase
MTFKEHSPFIVVSGLIGVGKTTLTQQLADHLQYEPYYEPVETNPYLEDFYRDMARWTFTMQMYLLAQRFEQHQEIIWSRKPAVLDRSIYEDTIFARMHREDGLMDDRDWTTYISHFNVMKSFLRYPDVILYLHITPDTAMKRIKQRARNAERTIEQRYIERLYEGYEEFADEMQRYTVVVTLDWSEFLPVDEVVNHVFAQTERKQKFLRSLRRI